MNKSLQKLKYILWDIFAAGLTWSLFFVYRKLLIEPHIFDHLNLIYEDIMFWIGLFIIPIFWNILYVSVGTYRKIYRKSRLKELSQTLTTSLIGVALIFFTLILDDQIVSYKNYYDLLLMLFLTHFGLTYIGRLFVTHRTIKRIHKGKIGFNTLIIGSNGNAVKVYNDFINQEYSSGNFFVGFVNAKHYNKFKMSSILPHLGSVEDVPTVITNYKIEEVIIAIERSETDTITNIITDLEMHDVVIKIIPLFQDYIFGNIKTSGIFQTPLVEISPDVMPTWQTTVKRTFDIIVSIIAIILLIPAYLFTAIGVKLSSPGSIIYSQERVGHHGKPFMMHKFRSMYSDAEKRGKPQLSSKTDPRITSFGSFIRKVRLDEIPQFFSVIKGDMSIVGPRPERQFFIDQISVRAPHYKLMGKIKPGITSWGQVKYGYAENVDEMIERLKYDVLYLENMSLAMDLKILIWTVLIVVQGRGK
ncbi:MAG: polyprenyl glycosylphosphotransferase [Bacteroidetes bacterium 4572_77]|nr:MAG: polyprenyl glycosylphosphotransferase [Bacteroidetes bacterium 4572_77]